jgi:hypothetical protein
MTAVFDDPSIPWKKQGNLLALDAERSRRSFYRAFFDVGHQE